MKKIAILFSLLLIIFTYLPYYSSGVPTIKSKKDRRHLSLFGNARTGEFHPFEEKETLFRFLWIMQKKDSNDNRWWTADLYPIVYAFVKPRALGAYEPTIYRLEIGTTYDRTRWKMLFIIDKEKIIEEWLNQK